MAEPPDRPLPGLSLKLSLPTARRLKCHAPATLSLLPRIKPYVPSDSATAVIVDLSSTSMTWPPLIYDAMGGGLIA